MKYYALAKSILFVIGTIEIWWRITLLLMILLMVTPNEFSMGKGFSCRNAPHQSNDDEGSNMRDDIDGLLHDTFRNVEGEAEHEEQMRETLSEDAKRFFRLLEEGKQELYPGCETFTKLSFTIRLYVFKSLHGLSNVAFSDMLELLKEVFPFAQLPESFNKARNMIKDLGLHYEKIHACPNDCMLFWKDNAKADNCFVCGASRWKVVDASLTNTSSKIPVKVLRYFPLKPRLQRIFMCPATVIAMRWHANERPNDGNMRHPADGEAWKDFDSLHPDFSRDPCNVRIFGSGSCDIVALVDSNRSRLELIDN
ncbi:uncharacterized protein LOC142181148 isoform X1 [Nicotiana tabacum]|uniref:Uncharacterized protein LOC142181148 isoform X1 n=1 Tax=Nicotiana tabacum TaxID=4097 RepID=A0AC58UJG4_TOBAC